jgi:hypothetical protein
VDRQWTPLKQPTRIEKGLLLEKRLRELRLPYCSTTVYSRQKQGAPDFIFPALKTVLWFYQGRDVLPRQKNEQDLWRALEFTVIMPETSAEALKRIQGLIEGQGKA